MFFFGKDDLGLAIRFRNKNYGTMLSLAFAITVELCKNRTVRGHPWPEQHEQRLGRGVVVPGSALRSECVQE